jgi:hypothetical protein
VIDRLLKNQNPLENRNNLRSSLAAPWSWTDVRGTAPQFCGPKFFDTGAAAVPSPVFGSEQDATFFRN